MIHRGGAADCLLLKETRSAGLHSMNSFDCQIACLACCVVARFGACRHVEEAVLRENI